MPTYEIDLASCCCEPEPVCDDFCTDGGEHRWDEARVTLPRMTGTWQYLDADNVTVIASFDLSNFDGTNILPWDDGFGQYILTKTGFNTTAYLSTTCSGGAGTATIQIFYDDGGPILGATIRYAYYGEGQIMPGQAMRGPLVFAEHLGSSGINAGPWTASPICAPGNGGPTFPATTAFRLLPMGNLSGFLVQPSMPSLPSVCSVRFGNA